MTTVREIIANSKFIESKGFRNLKPELSIIMPTYCRGQSGHFKLAVQSLIDQDFKNFELIIIDDASVDGTWDQIEDFLKKDSRIAVIRHASNVALPAISSIEGFLKSRANKIFNAFDDNIYTKSGINILMEDQINNPEHLVTYGDTILHQPNNEQAIVGHDFDYTTLKNQGNYIGNSAIIVDKKVIEDVGYYDPHIALARITDYDLWVRIGKKYNIYYIKTLVTSEYGITLANSLGNTYEENIAVSLEWMQRFRTPQLKPNMILDNHVDLVPETLSSYSRYFISEALLNKFKGERYKTPANVPLEKTGYLLFVDDINTASCQLCFEAYKEQIFFVTNQIFYNNPYQFLLGSRGVIFSRNLSHPKLEEILSILQFYQIPYYYFIDDNLFIMNVHNYLHTNKTMQIIKQAEAILVTSDQLANYVIDKKIHSNCITMTCTPTQVLRDSFARDVSHFNDSEIIRIVYASVTKSEGLKYFLEPFKKFINKTGKKILLYTISRHYEEKIIKDIFAGINNLELQILPIEYDYDRFCHILREKKIHFIIHPHGNEYLQIYKYKTLNMLITASFINAIPLITKRPPYDSYMTNQLIGDFIFDDMHKLLESMISYIEEGSQKALIDLNKIQLFINNNYPAEHNQRVIKNLLEKKIPLTINQLFRTLPMVVTPQNTSPSMAVTAQNTSYSQAIKKTIKKTIKKILRYNIGIKFKC